MPKQVKSSELPPAVAYIRLDDDEDPHAFAVLLKDIADCCIREGLRLTRTFTDRGYDGRELARPGIVELQQTLKKKPGLVVVVPTLEHLSPADSIRRALVLMICHLEGRIIVANKESDDGDGVAAGDAEVANRKDDAS